MLHTPVESPESKIARLSEDLSATKADLASKDAVIRQLRAELECGKLADKLQQTITLATNDPRKSAQHMIANITEAQTYVRILK